MIQIDCDVDAIHGIDGKLIRTGLDVQAHAVEHRFELNALLAAQGSAEDTLPAFELLLNEFAKSCDRAAQVLSHRILGIHIQ